LEDSQSNPDAQKRREMIRKVLRELEEELIQDLDPSVKTLDQIEEQAHRIGERAKRIVADQIIREKQSEDRQQSQAHCSQCGNKGRYLGLRSRQIVLRFGMQHLRRRSFHCAHCQCCFEPLDEDLALAPGQFSRFVTAAIARLSAKLTDREVRDELDGLLGVTLSVNTVQRRSHAVGQNIKREWDTRVEQMLSHRLPGSGVFPARLHTSADGVMLHIGGRWQEVKTASVFETNAAGEAIRIGYFASHCPSNVFGRYWRVLAHQAGMDHCCDVIVVADGAHWIWMEVGKYFPRSKQIVDLCHVMGYVWAVANLRFGSGSAEASAWCHNQSDLLKKSEADKVLANVRDWKPRKAECREAREDLISYFTEHKHRMAYASYLKENYQTGSGVEEACNKNVVQARMKQAGMRWGETRSESILQLCAWYHSHDRPKINRYLA
jgi:hypothetical protein